MGKSVIATNYSGNTDFTRQDNACLVDYTLQTVEPGCYYFQGDSVWADAHVEQAAHYMRRLVEDEDYRRGVGEKARVFMDEKHCFGVVGGRYRKRLRLIGLM